jgi:signal peptidase I
MNIPTPLSTQKVQRVGLNKITKAIIALAIICSIFVGSIVALRIFGLLNPFIYIPSTSMAPTVSPGDHVILENFTYMKRKPHRSDIVIFKSDGITSLQPATIYDKRIVGEPGEHLRISDGKIYINDVYVMITNSNGEIVYPLTEQMKPFVHYADVMIPQGQYFVIGDNSTNSLDSRSWGCLPAENIKGRICFCFWPPTRFGEIK